MIIFLKKLVIKCDTCELQFRANPLKVDSNINIGRVFVPTPASIVRMIFGKEIIHNSSNGFVISEGAPKRAKASDAVSKNKKSNSVKLNNLKNLYDDETLSEV